MNIIFMIIGAVVVFLTILLLFPSGSKNDIQDRLAALDDGAGMPGDVSLTEAELSKPFLDRVIRPFIARMAGKKDPKDVKKAAKSSLKKQLGQDRKSTRLNSVTSGSRMPSSA